MKKLLLIALVLIVSCHPSFNNEKAIEVIKNDLFKDSTIGMFEGGFKRGDYHVYKIKNINSIDILEVKEISALKDSETSKNIYEAGLHIKQSDLDFVKEQLNTLSIIGENKTLGGKSKDSLEKEQAVLNNEIRELNNKITTISDQLFKKQIGNELSTYAIQYRLNADLIDGSKKVFDTLFIKLKPDYSPF